MFKANKHFIAGAVCPRCGELDVVIIWKDENNNFRSCINCDYQESIDDSKIEGTNANLITRVSTGLDEKVVLDDDEKPLRLLNTINADPIDSQSVNVSGRDKGTHNT